MMASSDEWYTPKWIFEQLNAVFDLDVCTPHGGAWHTPAKRHICACCGDGLVDPWEGLIFMNPPYSAPKLWVKRFIEHNNGIALVPFSKSLWFHELWNTDGAIVPLPTNLKFDRPEGKPAQIFMNLFMIGLGNGIEVINKSGIGKVR